LIIELHGDLTFNKEWHLKNKFPKNGTEEEKNTERIAIAEKDD
jgi:hypothetical protein